MYKNDTVKKTTLLKKCQTVKKIPQCWKRPLLKKIHALLEKTTLLKKMLKQTTLLKFLAAPESVERHGCVRNGGGEVGKHNSARQLVGFQLEGILHRVGTKRYLPSAKKCFTKSKTPSSF